MSRRKRPHVRVDQELANSTVNALVEQGLTVRQQGRLLDEQGYQIRTREGPVVNLYDTGTITVSGNRAHLVDQQELRAKSAVGGDLALVVSLYASAGGTHLQALEHVIASAGIPSQTRGLLDEGWNPAPYVTRPVRAKAIVLITIEVEEDRRRYWPNVYFNLGLLVAQFGAQNVLCVSQKNVPLPASIRHRVVFSGRVEEASDAVMSWLNP